MEITHPKKYVKEKMQEKLNLPVNKEKENTYPFQWLIFKPQQHAIESFKINEPSRSSNTTRTN